MIGSETPELLLENRFAALQAEDYVSVYASYHREAPFRRQFADREAYLAFARQHLRQIQLHDWQLLRQRPVTPGQVEVILGMEVGVDGGKEFFYELALLIETAAGWRYHSAQKLSAEDYSAAPERLDFVHFDQVAEKIRF